MTERHDDRRYERDDTRRDDRYRDRNGQRKSNGNGNSWLLWVNTILVLAVSSLLGLLWTSSSDRFTKLELKAENFSRLERVEELVRKQGLAQERSDARLENMIERNREDIDRSLGRRR